ncbi:hypothetical protein Hanom_Chr13g01218351 [Helianthus anomalus]
MSTGDHHEDSTEEIAVELPPLKWSRETFDSLIRNFRFPKSWDARYRNEGQTAADAPAGYITLFWDFFSLGNFRLLVTKFFLDILAYYKFHISQMHPIGMDRVRHFEFVYRTMNIEPSLEKALVGAAMSLCWQMNRDDKPVYMEGDKVVSLYVISFEIEGGKMATIPKKSDEELWYHRIARNFVFSRDEDLTAQPSSGVGELTNLGIGPEKKRRARTVVTVPKKNDADRAQSSKTKNVRGETKGMRHSSDSCCDYVVVSDSLEGLALVVVRRPKSEPRDTANIPPSNPDDPIDLESSPEHLLRKKAGKRKQTDTEADSQPVKKPNSPVPVEPSSMVNVDLPPSPPRAPISEELESTEAADNETEKTAGAENPDVEKPTDAAVNVEKLNSPEAVDVDVGHPQSPEVVAGDPEKGKSAQEIPNTTSPSAVFGSVSENVKKNLGGNQDSFIQPNENSPIHPDETPGDYYYRCYSEKQADEVHAPVWKLKKGDTFSDWRVCREWLHGNFPPGEIKFEEGRPHEQTYNARLEEAASYTSTMHRIMREWHSMHKEWAAFKASKKKAAEDEA